MTLNLMFGTLSFEALMTTGNIVWNVISRPMIGARGEVAFKIIMLYK